MPVHTTEDNLTASHYKDGEVFKSKGEEVIFQDTDDGTYYIITIEKGVVTPILMNPQPVY